MMADTVFAPATPPGRGGVAVVRVSGSRAALAITSLTGREPPPARIASLRALCSADGERLDTGLVLWFPAPGSFTGEDVAEFHLHGGRAVVAGVVAALGRLAGFRTADPGEFTRRAFHNRKLDLTEAEAVADLVDAETAAQRRQALRQLDGALGRLYEGWRDRLVRALAHLEADIDFPDEDLPTGLAASVAGEVEALMRDITVHLADGGRGERLREGLHVAIIGAPNTGKSSLLNALARREAAIVSAQAGTTRDVVEVQLDLGGYPLVLADTAGLRESTDDIEREGVRRSRARAAAADLKLAVFDADCWPEIDATTLPLVDADTLVVVNKVDLVRPVDPVIAGRRALAVSARTGDGLAALEAALAEAAADRLAGAGGAVLTRQRHRSCLEECRDALLRASDAPLPELAVEDVRLATRALGRITGRVGVEDVLDVIFGEFCIGK